MCFRCITSPEPGGGHITIPAKATEPQVMEPGLVPVSPVPKHRTVTTASFLGRLPCTAQLPCYLGLNSTSKCEMHTLKHAEPHQGLFPSSRWELGSAVVIL